VVLLHTVGCGKSDVVRQADTIIAVVDKMDFMRDDWIKASTAIIDMRIKTSPFLPRSAV